MNSLHVKKILQSKIKAEVLETVEFEEASAQTLNGTVGEIITAILKSKRWEGKFILKVNKVKFHQNEKFSLEDETFF